MSKAETRVGLQWIFNKYLLDKWMVDGRMVSWTISILSHLTLSYFIVISVWVL